MTKGVRHLSTHGQGWTWFRPAVVLPVAVALTFVVVITFITRWADERRQGQVHLARVENVASRQSLELGRATALAAVADGKATSGLRHVMPGLVPMLEKLDDDVHDALDALAQLSFASEEAERIHDAHHTFADEVMMAAELMQAGRYDEAWIYNRQRIDPDYQALRNDIQAVNASFDQGAERAMLFADLGTIAVLIAGAVAYIFLRRRFERHREAMSKRLAHQAYHDPLTDLCNRTMLEERMVQAIARTRRSRSPMALLFIDIDNFKTINDSLGHHGGDLFLIEVAERLRSCTRDSDTTARLGGDEFAVLLEDMTGPEDAEEVAERILASLCSPFEASGRSITASCSIGLSVSLDGTESVDELLGNADVAMYAAKGSGKDGFETFSPGMRLSQLDQEERQAELQAAIDNEELVVHYQPIVNLDSDEMVGVEALVRWQHPERGIVPPLEFIPLAEETGQIVAIGGWVLQEACRQVAEWRAAQPGLSLSVNLSAVQFGHHDLVDDVRTALIRSGLEPSALILEITESTLMTDGDPLTQLEDLKRLGVKLAIDDFGVGYSSLSYLRRFPVDHLKIDRSFVQSIGGGPEDAALCEAIVKLGQTLGLATVAEGIEDPDQLEWFRGKRCPFGQGFLFQAPVPAADFGQLLNVAPSGWAKENLTAV